MVPRKILEISPYTHYKSLSSLLLLLVVFIIIIAWEEFSIVAFACFSVMFLIDAFPSFYLHIEYWLENKDEEYEILSNEIVQRKKGLENRYSSDEIEKIIFFLSPTFYKNSNVTLLTMDRYFYAEIVLKSGEQIIMTRLLSGKLQEDLKQIKGVLFERRKTQFCNINKWR